MDTHGKAPALMNIAQAEQFVSDRTGIGRIDLNLEIRRKVGPPYRQWGRDRYFAESDLAAWVDARWSETAPGHHKAG